MASCTSMFSEYTVMPAYGTLALTANSRMDSGCPEKTWKKQTEDETRAVGLGHNDTMERVK